MNVCVRVCVCERERERERERFRECVCVDERVSVYVCEKRERVWVYVCVMVWACVDLAFVPSSILHHSRRNYCCIVQV